MNLNIPLEKSSRLIDKDFNELSRLNLKASQIDNEHNNLIHSSKDSDANSQIKVENNAPEEIESNIHINTREYYIPYELKSGSPIDNMNKMEIDTDSFPVDNISVDNLSINNTEMNIHPENRNNELNSNLSNINKKEIFDLNNDTYNQPETKKIRFMDECMNVSYPENFHESFINDINLKSIDTKKQEWEFEDNSMKTETKSEQSEPLKKMIPNPIFVNSINTEINSSPPRNPSSTTQSPHKIIVENDVQIRRRRNSFLRPIVNRTPISQSAKISEILNLSVKKRLDKFLRAKSKRSNEPQQLNSEGSITSISNESKFEGHQKNNSI